MLKKEVNSVKTRYQMGEDITYGAHLPAAMITADFLPPAQESSCITSISP
jgi:hypothetical protein